MQKLVFFISQNDRDNELSSNIGNLYMNRFIIDEDAGHEIVKIYEVKEYGQFIQRSPLMGFKIFQKTFPEFLGNLEEKERLGVGHSFVF